MWKQATRPSGPHLSNRSKYKKIGLALSPKLSPNSPAQAVEFTKWGSHTADAPMQRARRSIGRTVLERFLRSSNTTSTGAEYDGSCCSKTKVFAFTAHASRVRRG